MTEEEWLGASDPIPMVEEYWYEERKLRLFSVAACRGIRHLLSGSAQAAVTVAERFADGAATADELIAAGAACPITPGSLRDAAAEAAHWAASIKLEALLCSRDIGFAVSREAEGRYNWVNQASKEVRAHHCDLLRHIIGNPFRPYPAPSDWPAGVVRLAEALYAGGDIAFALGDALLEAGHPELAAHFRGEVWHPKGCWVLDLLTGRE